MTKNDTEPNDVAPAPPKDKETPKERRNRLQRERRARAKAKSDAKAQAEGRDPDAPKSGPQGGRPVGSGTKHSKRAVAVTGVVALVGTGVATLNATDGEIILEGAADLGTALANLAERNSKVAAALDAMTEVSAWSEVALAVASIALPIMANHRNPAPLPAGDPDPAPPVRPVTFGDTAPDPEDVPAFTVQPRPDANGDEVPTFTARHTD